MDDADLHELATLVLTKPAGSYTAVERDRLVTLLHEVANDLEKASWGSEDTTRLTLYGVGV